MILNPAGEIIAHYSKLHTFDVTLPDGSVQCESARIRPGDHLSLVDTPLGTLGMAICYDIRFGSGDLHARKPHHAHGQGSLGDDTAHPRH